MAPGAPASAGARPWPRNSLAPRPSPPRSPSEAIRVCWRPLPPVVAVLACTATTAPGRLVANWPLPVGSPCGYACASAPVRPHGGPAQRGRTGERSRRARPPTRHRGPPREGSDMPLAGAMVGPQCSWTAGWTSCPHHVPGVPRVQAVSVEPPGTTSACRPTRRLRPPTGQRPCSRRSLCDGVSSEVAGPPRGGEWLGSDARR